MNYCLLHALDKSAKSKEQSSLVCGDQHKYILTDEEIESIFQREVYLEIINSRAFQRLKNIHFLGAIDYVFEPNTANAIRRHTRFQHTLGVAKLALQFAYEEELPVEKEVNCVVSALLHDIGHAPLSHTLESVFQKEFGISHHVSSERIIRGDEVLGKKLHEILLKWKIHPFNIMSIVCGACSKPYRTIFGNSINIDTIEAISRSSTYLHKNPSSPSPSKILSALLARDSDSTIVLDNFWKLKHEVYTKLINSKVGVIADYICQKYMQDNLNKFEKCYFYSEEDIFKKIHSPLFEILDEFRAEGATSYLKDVFSVEYRHREFYIDENVRLSDLKSINDRYRQRKARNNYIIKSTGVNDGTEAAGVPTENLRLF